MRRAMWIAILAAAAALTASPAATASTLSGTCTLSGRLDFDRPLGNVPHYVRFSDHAAGACSGSLDGASASNLPVVLRARGSGWIGCLASRTKSTGTLTFATGQRIRFWTDGHGLLTELVAT